MRTVTTHKYDKERGVPVPGLWRQDVDSKDLLRLRQAGVLVKEIASRFSIAKSTVCERLKHDFPKEYKALRVIPSRIQYYALCARAHKVYQELGSYGKAAKALKWARTTTIQRVQFMGEVLSGTVEITVYPTVVVEKDEPVFVKPMEGEDELDFERTFPYPTTVPGIVESTYGKDILDDIEVVGNGSELF